MEAKNYDSLIEVFRGDLWEAELIKGLLKSAGVDAMLKDLPMEEVPYACWLIRKKKYMHEK